MGTLMSQQMLLGRYGQFALVGTFVNQFLGPLIYAAVLKEFRDGYKLLLRKVFSMVNVFTGEFVVCNTLRFTFRGKSPTTLNIRKITEISSIRNYVLSREFSFFLFSFADFVLLTRKQKALTQASEERTQMKDNSS